MAAFAFSLSFMPLTTMKWKARLRAAAIHLCICAGVAIVVAAVSFGLWYPKPYDVISGGGSIFLVLISVDAVLGPAITLIVFNPLKRRKELVLDVALIAVLQSAALAYGLHTIFWSRPIQVVFEYDRFRVVHANEIPESLVSSAPSSIDPMPLTGPTWIALRKLSVQESFDYTLQAMGGVPVSAHPNLWQPYKQSEKEIVSSAMPLSTLTERKPSYAPQISAAIEGIGKPVSELRFLPLQGRKDIAWTAILDIKTAQVVSLLPIDPF